MLEAYFCARVRQPLHNVSALQVTADLRPGELLLKVGSQGSKIIALTGIFFNE